MNGILKGSYYGTMSDIVSVTVRGGASKTKLRTLIEYKEESWLGKPRFALEGVIYRTTEDDADKYKKLKSVPSDKVVAHLEGNWMRQIRYRLKGEKVGLSDSRTEGRRPEVAQSSASRWGHAALAT